MKRWAGFSLAAIMFLLCTAGMWYVSPLFSRTVYAGVTIANIEIGGKSREEVAQMLTVWQKSQKPKPILLSYETTTFRLEPENIDFTIDAEATADSAWRVGREDSWWERLKNIRTARQEGWPIELKIRYNESKLDAIIEQMQEAVNRPPHNATLSLRTGGIVPEEEGREIDIALLKQLVANALNRAEAGTFELPVKPVYPEITISELHENGIKELVAVYATEFKAEDINRSANVKLAAQKINGKLLSPGQVFSYNETVGPREKSCGFKEAMEIINGEFVPGVGGGVCQVSSTLYNAVLLAGMGIVERTNHSKPLSYVPLGRDATVVYDALDFKFVNNTSAPIMVMAETSGNKLNVGIFGQRALDKNIEILTTEQQIIPPKIVKKVDPGLPPGETLVEKPGKPGYVVTAIRIIRDNNGKEVKREVLSRDKYAPDNTVVKMGLQAMPEMVVNQPEASSTQ